MEHTDNLVLLVNGAHGVYVPKVFAEFDLGDWKGIAKEDIEILKAGPDREHYWDAWQNILDNARTLVNGREYALYQDGDLWAYDVQAMQDNHPEMVEFFGCEY
jgi:hypothetical protein